MQLIVLLATTAIMTAGCVATILVIIFDDRLWALHNTLFAVTFQQGVVIAPAGTAVAVDRLQGSTIAGTVAAILGTSWRSAWS